MEKKRETEKKHNNIRTLWEGGKAPEGKWQKASVPLDGATLSCHARVREDAVSITEHRHEAELLPLVVTG